MDKDPSILKVLDRLRSTLGPQRFILADHWQEDLCAVGIAQPRNPGLLVYISTLGAAEGRYHYELELPPQDAEFPYTLAGRACDVTFDELVTAAAAHLNTLDQGDD